MFDPNGSRRFFVWRWRSLLTPTACASLLLAAAASGCERVEPWASLEAEAATERGSGAAAAGGSPSSILPTPAAVEVVALRGRPTESPAERTSAASASELAALRDLLGVPVAGVARSDLRDSYTEARGERVHEAMDVLVPRGTPVLSASDGRLLKLFDSVPGGLMIYAADPSNRFILFYGHLDGYAAGLREGMALTRGQVIGYVGTTGNAPATTPHLHFGILRGQPSAAWSEGVPVNPYTLLTRVP